MKVKLRFSVFEVLVAAGCNDGSVVMLKLSESLSTTTKEDRASLLQLFDRETKREKILEGIQREKMLKQRTDRGLKSAVNKMRVLGLDTFKKIASRQTEEEIQISADLERAEKDFYESVQKSVAERRANNKPVVFAEEY